MTSPPPDLRDEVRTLMKRCGEAVAEDPRLLEAGLLDLCKGTRRREIKLLCDAVRLHVPSSLRASEDWSRRGPKLIERMVNDCAVEESAARAAVGTWQSVLRPSWTPESTPSAPPPASAAPAPVGASVEAGVAGSDDAAPADGEQAEAAPKPRRPKVALEARAQSGAQGAAAVGSPRRSGLQFLVPFLGLGVLSVATVAYYVTNKAGAVTGSEGNKEEPKFSPPPGRQIRLSVVGADVNLACASDQTPAGRYCAFGADHLVPRSEAKPPDSRLLQPFTTLDGDTILAAGLWSQIGSPALGSDERALVRCGFVVEGRIASPMLRFRGVDWKVADKRELETGLLKDCKIERTAPSASATPSGTSQAAPSAAPSARVVDLDEHFEGGRLTVSAGAVFDRDTGLEWRQQVSSPLSAAGAGGYCRGLGDGVEWRLPSAKELRTLVRPVSPPTLSHDAFPNAPAADFWSSDGLQGACPTVVSFADGQSRVRCNEGLRLAVRCVHGTPLAPDPPSEPLSFPAEPPAEPEPTAAPAPTPSVQPQVRPTIDLSDEAPI